MSRLSTRLVAMLAAAAMAAGLLAVATAPPAAAAFANGLVRFEGHGWGHGRGLGQYGSYGYAVDEGRDYSWILDHFYGGTTKGSKADGTISVKLTFLEGTTAAPVHMTVTSGSAYTIGDVKNTFAAGEYGRVRWNGAGFTIERGAACAGPWTTVQEVGPDARPEAKTAYVGDDHKQMLTVLQPVADKTCDQWNKRTYRGSLMMARLDSVFTRVLNWVQMEQYLRGVVPRESPASWGDAGGGKGMEALKSQSVAARSYAWAESRHKDYKTCDTTQCQVYGGAALNGVRSEHANTDAAIAATAGEVRINAAGGVARTEFSSSTGGHTDGPSFTPVPDTGDDTAANPNHEWSASVTVESIQTRHPQIGTLRSIGVLGRNGLGSMGGRATEVQLVGSSGSVTLKGDGAIRGGLGLKSAWFKTVDVILDVTRLQGEDRIATSNAISAGLFPDGTAAAAVLVSARDFPDAILGVPLAVAKNGPILLSDADAVPASTMAELQRATGGGKPVYLLGGTVPLSEGVRTQLEAAGYQVTRYGGATRAATAVQVAEALGNPSTVLLATGADFPDALAAGAAAAKAGGAVLLTAGSTMAPETAAYLEGRSVTKYAVGGGAAAADPAATPLAGPDRYETALKVANQFFPGPAAAGLASGAGFADALSGGVHAAMKNGPLVLTAPTALPLSTKQYLQGNADVTLRTLYVYGGPGAVADAVLDDLKKR